MTINKRLCEMLNGCIAKAAAQLLVHMSPAAEERVGEKYPNLAKAASGAMDGPIIGYQPRPDPYRAIAGRCLALRLLARRESKTAGAFR